MRTLLNCLLSAAAVVACAGVAGADVYTDGTLTVDWSRTGDDFAGTFTLGAQKFPATAHASGHDVKGDFKAGDAAFAFTGTLDDRGALRLSTGGRDYTLARKDAPVNPLAGPLAAPAAANPLAASAGVPDAAGRAAAPGVPAGYTVVLATEQGVALKSAKPGAKSVQAALRAALPDVAGLLDARPAVGGAVEDQTDHQSGVAVFTGTRQGKPVRGTLGCRLTPAGADVSIVAADSAAAPEAWQKLAAAAAPGNAAANAAPAVKMADYRFPDGTGTLGLPDGWSTRATSILDPIQVDGPGDAHVFIGSTFYVSTPDSPLVRMYEQNCQMARQMNMPPPPPLRGFFAPFGDPADALKAIVPQFNAMSAPQGGFTIKLDKFNAVKPAPANLQGGRAQLMDYLYTKTDKGEPVQFHSVARGESAPIGEGAWILTFVELTAPATRFDALQGTMAAILNSGKPDADVVARVTQERNAAMRQQIQQSGANSRVALQQQFDAGQAAHKQQMASYDAHNRAWAAGQNTQARTNDNFIEMIRGTCPVLDTQTGERRTVDLTDAAGVAQSLNDATNDPNRFKPIPLRDDNDPLPGQ